MMVHTHAVCTKPSFPLSLECLGTIIALVHALRVNCILVLAHTHTADQLFQYIANETNTAKTSSSYGLKRVENSSQVSERYSVKKGIIRNSTKLKEQ